jgi:restriction endonuclease S subunit
MNKQMKDIANIRSGYTFRGKAEEYKNSGVQMLQIKDLNDTGIIDTSTLLEIKWDGALDKAVIEKGEIVIVAKGGTNRAAMMIGNGTVIPSNQLMIIRVLNQTVLPEYLCWWLNRSATQKTLRQQQMGTSIPSLSKQTLSRLTVPIPTTDMQQKIVELNRLQQQEKQVYEQLINNRDKMLEGLFQELVHNGEDQ